jgi:hypothetical protein
MKTTLFFVFLLISVSNTYCQSWEIEEQNINKIIQSGKTQLEVQELVKDWRTFRSEFGDYPNLPFNEKNEIEYTYIINNQLSKEIIFDRVLEWSSINFGSLDAVLHYKNLESGKIILKGRFEIVYSYDYEGFWGNKKQGAISQECKQTYIFTIKNNKLKIQVIDVEVEVVVGGFMGVNSYIPEEKFSFPLSKYYPITNSNKNDRVGNFGWKANLNLLTEISNRIATMTTDLNEYISNYQNDFSF